MTCAYPNGCTPPEPVVESVYPPFDPLAQTGTDYGVLITVAAVVIVFGLVLAFWSIKRPFSSRGDH